MKTSAIALAFLAVLFISCGGNTNADKPVLYYQDPDNPNVLSDSPKKNAHGEDFIPVYADAEDKNSVSSDDVWYYTCPMHPDVRTHEPGNCPICKMELVPVQYPEVKNAAVEYYYCPMHPEVREKAPGNCPICGMVLAPKYVLDQGVYSSVQITPEQEKNIGVRLSEVSVMNLQKSVKTVGKIAFDEQKLYMISSRIDGRLDKLFVNFTGAPVSKGQPLLLIYSPPLITAQEELLQTYREYTNSQNPVEQSLSVLSLSLLNSSKKKLSLLGMSDKQIDTILKTGETQVHTAIYSPINGTVLKMNAYTGMYVKEGDIIYEIADLSSVWMEAEIYEQDISDVHIGMEVSATGIAFPEKALKGKITFISPLLDPMTRTVKIRAEFQNPGGILKPGMYVDAVITGKTQQKALVIPATALLDTGMRKIVYVSLGNGLYEGRTVIVKPKIGDYFPVVSGLKEGEKVVTYGAYLIDSQAQLSGSASIQYSGAMSHEK
ncbi:MAG: efflux RND transporter periplasmic adaptor subunit [Brevinematales bacterium]|nr:efflux RND transporter periplasmic adaptor subunit [Brevinematales bacterium]